MSGLLSPISIIRQVDTSKGRGAGIERELRAMREDNYIQSKEVMKSFKEATSQATSKSPYWPDRNPTPEKIHGAPEETDWKKGVSRYETPQEFGKANLKKLNIV